MGTQVVNGGHTHRASGTAHLSSVHSLHSVSLGLWVSWWLCQHMGCTGKQYNASWLSFNSIKVLSAMISVPSSVHILHGVMFALQEPFNSKGVAIYFELHLSEEMRHVFFKNQESTFV